MSVQEKKSCYLKKDPSQWLKFCQNHWLDSSRHFPLDFVNEEGAFTVNSQKSVSTDGKLKQV